MGEAMASQNFLFRKNINFLGTLGAIAPLLGCLEQLWNY